jgi:hypothetical protein
VARERRRSIGGRALTRPPDTPRRPAPPHAAPHRPRAAQIEKDGFMDEQEAEEEEEEEVKATPKKGACKRASKQANKRLVFARARPGARRGAAHPRDP